MCSFCIRRICSVELQAAAHLNTSNVFLHKYFSTYYSPNNIKKDCSCHEHGLFGKSDSNGGYAGEQAAGQFKTRKGTSSHKIISLRSNVWLHSSEIIL